MFGRKDSAAGPMMTGIAGMMLQRMIARRLPLARLGGIQGMIAGAVIGYAVKKVFGPSTKQPVRR